MIIPTVFAHNKKEFQEKFKKILPIAKNIQIDFLDGKFVKAKSVSLSQIPNLKKYKKNFEAHLMVKNPQAWIPKLKKKGFKKIIFHIETTSQPEKLIQKIKDLKLRSMVAINPKTSIDKLPKKVPVLFLGVNPGKEHQSFIPAVYNKIKSFRKKNKRIAIQIDGGVSHKNIVKLARIGVDAVNSGSYISSAKNPKQAYKKLTSIFRKAKL